MQSCRAVRKYMTLSAQKFIVRCVARYICVSEAEGQVQTYSDWPIGLLLYVRSPSVVFSNTGVSNLCITAGRIGYSYFGRGPQKDKN
jgi:hypothetical protein